MDIAYLTQSSQFLDPCEAAIGAYSAELYAGSTVQIDLPKGGYDGLVILTIHQDDLEVFGTDWKGTDPTRFPARIKAAATALKNCHCWGRFEIVHTDGSLRIRVV